MTQPIDTTHRRPLLVACTWIVALLITIVSPFWFVAPFFLPVFPGGLLRLLPAWVMDRVSDSQFAGYFFVLFFVGSWVFYGVYTGYLIVFQHSRWFWPLYIFLAVILLFNAVSDRMGH